MLQLFLFFIHERQRKCKYPARMEILKRIINHLRARCRPADVVGAERDCERRVRR